MMGRNGGEVFRRSGMSAIHFPDHTGSAGFAGMLPGNRNPAITTMRQQHVSALRSKLAVALAFLCVAVCASGMNERLRVIDQELEYPRSPGQELSLLSAKSVYPLEDRHLDLIVWLGESVRDKPEGALEVVLQDAGGKELSKTVIDPIPGGRLSLAPPIPGNLAGETGRVRVIWRRDRGDPETAEAEFRITEASGVARSGRIPIQLPNPEGVRWEDAPYTVGVPFPRGALDGSGSVRLVDAEGAEIPLQTEVTGRWSRHGPVRWLRCDFTADLEGGPKTVYLEYGGNGASEQPGAPARAQPLQFSLEDGVAFQAGNGSPAPVLQADALSGAFLRDGEGNRYRMAEAETFEKETTGPEKTVFKAEGWYENPENGDRYCQYVTRFIVHHGSRMVRLRHTWIFTGDAYEDRIGEMGWHFPAAGEMRPLGFPVAHGEKPDGLDWLKADYLVQRDFNRFETGLGGTTEEHEGRPAGIMGGEVGDVRLLVGNLDFANNYPRELAADTGGLTFYEWPEHGGEREHTRYHRYPNRLWFAHEGEELDFALPEAYAKDPRILREIASSRRDNRNYTYRGLREERVNAQGIAKTAELWLLFSETGAPIENEVAILRSLEEGELQPVVDPEWVAESGALGKIHPRDTENFPEAEYFYELHAQAPIHWAKRARVYGKWLWGVTPHAPELRERYQKQHRAFRKSHQGWPYSWLPFARSGDPRFFRYTDAVTRFQTDIAFVHYSDQRVPHFAEPGAARPRGWYTRDRIPWAHNRKAPTSRAREDKVHYLLHSYYLTGYRRAWDVVRDYAWLTKHEGVGLDGRAWDSRDVLDFKGPGDERRVETLLRTYTELYQATFDPWFLTAAHRIAGRVKALYDFDEVPGYKDVGYVGSFYNTGIETFYRYTGDPDIEAIFQDLAETRFRQREEHSPVKMAGWARMNSKYGGGFGIESLALAADMTGDPFLLGRLAGVLDRVKGATYDGEPEYFRGYFIRAWHLAVPPMFTGWYLSDFPVALRTLAEADSVPEPIPAAFWQMAASAPEVKDGVYHHRFPEIAVRKAAGEELPVHFHVKPKPSKNADYGGLFNYVIRGPGRFERMGQGKTAEPDTVTLPADAPGGVYRVRVELLSERGVEAGTSARPGLYVPLTPPGSPEVMIPRSSGRARLDGTGIGERVSAAADRREASGMRGGRGREGTVSLPREWTLAFRAKDERPRPLVPETVELGELVTMRGQSVKLDGPWYFRRDPDNRGLERGWHRSAGKDGWRPIEVPAHWSETRVGDYLGYGWYRTRFALSPERAATEQQLRFEGVDEQAWVYLNGRLIGKQTEEATGKSAGRLWDKPFSVTLEPSDLREEGQNVLVVRTHAGANNGGIFKPVRIEAPDADLGGLALKHRDPGDWEHVALVSTPERTRLYVDGKLADSVDRPVWPHRLRTVRVAIGGGSELAFKGWVTDFEMYDEAFSGEAVAALAEGGERTRAGSRPSSGRRSSGQPGAEVRTVASGHGNSSVRAAGSNLLNRAVRGAARLAGNAGAVSAAVPRGSMLASAGRPPASGASPSSTADADASVDGEGRENAPDGPMVVGQASAYATYWFRIPEDMERLRVRFTVPYYAARDDDPLVRFTIWNAEREIVWKEQFDRGQYPERKEVEASVEIPEEQRGRLWRIYLPHQRALGENVGFSIDGAIEPFLSVSRTRWFHPGAADAERARHDPAQTNGTEVP